jgi:hypothetical protein
MITFDMFGTAGLYLKFSGDLLDTAQGIPAAALHPPSRYYLRFTAGVATLVVGATLVGQTSAVVLTVNGIAITSGTLATSDATGILFVTVVSGTLAADENLRIATTTQCVSRTALITMPVPYRHPGVARSVLMHVETNTIRFLYDGSAPTTSSETGDASFGVPLADGQSMPLKGEQNITNLKFINAATASNGVLNLVIYYGGGE